MNQKITPQLADNAFRLYHELSITKISPVFTAESMQSQPYVFNFTQSNSEVTGLVEKGGADFQIYTDNAMRKAGATWGIGGYLERRDGVLKNTHIGNQKRFYHLGVDIAFPAGTPVFSPLDGEIYKAGYSPEWGDYGNYLSTYHELNGIPFYLFYGHLKEGSMKTSGSVKAGETIAALGDFEENGQWFHHIHLQICMLPWENGTTPDGYCKEDLVDSYRLLNPNPLLLIRDFVPSVLSAN